MLVGFGSMEVVTSSTATLSRKLFGLHLRLWMQPMALNSSRSGSDDEIHHSNVPERARDPNACTEYCIRVVVFFFLSVSIASSRRISIGKGRAPSLSSHCGEENNRKDRNPQQYIYIYIGYICLFVCLDVSVRACTREDFQRLHAVSLLTR